MLLEYPVITAVNYLDHRPKDTPFEDGTFKLTMQFSEEYPNKPPTVRFVSKMFHPNGEPFHSLTASFVPFIQYLLPPSSYSVCRWKYMFRYLTESLESYI